MGAYLELIRQQEQTNKQETDLRTNMMQAAETDPDSLARAKKSADLLGLPLQAVQERLPDVEKQAFVEGFGYRDLIKNAPKTAEWLAADGVNAGLAKDDVENLTLLESILARAEAYPRSLAAGPLRLNAALWGLPRAGADVLSTLVTGPLSEIGILPEDIGAKMSAAAARQQAAAGRITESVRGDVSQFGPNERAVLGGLESAGQTLVSVPASIVTGNPAIMLGTMTASTGGEAYGQARDQGIPVGQALTFASSQAAVEYATEKIPVGVLFRDLGLKQTLTRTLANQLIAEMPQEQVATVLQDLNEWATLNADRPFSEYLAARPEAALQTAIATAVGTTVQTAATTAIDTAVNGPRHKQNEQLFKAIGDTAQNSKLRERLPEKYRELAEKYAGAQNVFVDAGQFQQYFQSQGVDPAAIAAELGVKNYVEALTAGTDVVIPMADFATKLAPTDYLQGLMPDLKLAQGELSAREYEAWQSEQGEQPDIETEQADPDATQGIYDDVLGQLVGRFERGTAESYAQVYTAGISNLARRMGLDPMELHQRYGLSVTSPLPDVLRSVPNIDTMIDPMLDALRAGKVPTDAEVNGPSLIEFLRERGGIKDMSGELAGRDANLQTPKGKRNLIQADGLDMDIAREAAAEAGYLDSDTDINEFLELIDQELRGQPVYSQRNVDQSLQAQQASLAQLGEWLDQIGVDLTAVDNAAIKEMLGAAQDAVEGERYDQGTAQTDTPEFKAWFGDSKVVDAEGRPLVVYHGTADSFDQFDLEHPNRKDTGWLGEGVYLTDDPDLANAYSNLKAGSAAPNVMPLYASIKNPFTATIEDKRRLKGASKSTAKAWTKSLQEAGYDGVILDYGNGTREIVAFEPTQVKSATGNRGTFDAGNANILFQGEQRDLLAQHNLSAENLLHAEKMGGIPVPSLAVVKKDAPITGFGEITLLASPEMIDPKGYAKTKVFGADIYSPRYPQISYKLDKDALTKLNRLLEPYQGEGRQIYGSEINRVDDLMQVDAFKKYVDQKLGDTASWSQMKSAAADLLNQAGAKERIFQGYTYSGNRKYIDHTLENVVKLLKQELRGGEGYNYGLGSVRSRFTPQFKSIADIRKNKRRLMDKAGFEAAKEELEQELFALTDTLAPYHWNSKNFGFLDTVTSAMSDAAKMGIPRALSENGFEDVPADAMEPVRQFLEKLRNMPTEYFEAKILRDVDLAEFSGAVVPDNVDARVVDALKKRGVDDIRYYKNGDEADRAAKIQQFERVFFQRTADDKRGFIRIGPDRKLSISLLEKADLSTVLHEMGHAWLEIMGDLAEADNAPRQIKDDYATILKWMGVNIRADVKVEQHEMFARANEAYLMEGKAPSTALQRIFSRFKAWLTMIYRSMSRLNVQLTPEVRAVFDRIYASDAEIEAAQNEAGLPALFMDATAAGMTDAEFEAYRASVETASVEAQDKLRAQMMAEYQREQQKWWKERRAQVRDTVAAEIAEQPVYRAFRELTAGDMKLNKADLVRRYGDEYLKRLPRSFQRVYTVDGGVDLDMAAEMFGYDSGDAMVQALVNMRPAKELIEAETDARMREEYGDMRFDDTAVDRAQEALHNDRRVDVMMAELRALRRKQREVAPFVRAERQRQAGERAAARDAAAGVPPASEFKRMAQGMIAQQAIKDLQPNRYLLAERKASRRAFEAMAKGDVNVAANEKQRELLNHYLYLEATAAKERADKIAEYADGLTKAKAQERVGKGGEEYLAAMNEILVGYEFRRVTNKQINVREAMRAAMARADAEGEVIDVMTDDDGNIIDPVLAAVRNYRELTIDELQAVRDMLKNIEHVAREKTKFRAAEVKASFDDLATAGLAEIEAGTKAKDKPRRSLRTPWQDKKRFVAGIPQSWRGLYSYIQKATGYAEDAKGLNNTTLWNYLVRPLNEAAAREAVMLREAALKLDEIFDRYSTTYLYGKGKEVAPGITLNKQEQIMIAASYGTETGRQRMLDNGFDGRGFTQGEIDAILNSLEEVDWQVVQDIWKLFDSYWSQISDKAQRVTGVRPEKVDALPFETRFGTMSGGYSPIAYETMLDNRAAAQDSAQIAKEMQQAAYTRSTTRRGFLKQRVQRLQGKAVRYDFGVIYKHLNEVIHDVTHHEALRDVQKLLNHKVEGRSIIDEITVRLGDGVRDEIRKTLEDVAVGDIRAMTNTERFMERLAKGSSVAGLAYNVWSALQNFTGIANSLAVIGPKAVFSGAMELIGSPAHMLGTMDQVYEKSEFMRTRFLNMNRDVAAFRGKLEERTGVQAADTAYQAFRNGGFWMMVRVQQLVDMPTWLGAYRSALRSDPSMTEANAVALADQAVVAAQGGGRNIDMSQFMRGKGWARVWTVYAGYFNVVYQRTIESMERAGIEGYTPAAVGRMVTDMFFLMMAPAILTTMLKEAVDLMVGGDADDEDELMMKYLKEQLSYILAMFPFVRETAAGFLGFGNYSGPVGARFFKEVNDLGQQVVQGEVDEKLVKEAVGVAGFGVGLPTSQAIKTYDGFQAMMDGNATPAALAFGPPRE